MCLCFNGTGMVNKDPDMKRGNHNGAGYHELVRTSCVRSRCSGKPCWCCPSKPICKISKEACDILCFF